MRELVAELSAHAPISYVGFGTYRPSTQYLSTSTWYQHIGTYLLYKTGIK
jgi:hypothetical protein